MRKKVDPAFYEELAKLMIRHGVRDIRYLTCHVSEAGKLLFNKDHIAVLDDSHISVEYGDHADKIIQESLIDYALAQGNKELFFDVINRTNPTSRNVDGIK